MKHNNTPGDAMPQQMSGQLCTLLKQAMVAKLSSVRQYLALGGQPNEFVRIVMAGKQLDVPLLHSLVLETHSEVAPSVALLLAAGARPNVTCLNHNGLECTALMFAMDNCCCNTLQALLQGGADVLQRNSQTGEFPLHHAAKVGDDAAFRVIAAASAQRATAQLKFPDFRDNAGMTPLLLAAKGGKGPVLKHLRELGADLNAVNNNGDTGLILGCHTHCWGVTNFFLVAGANANARGAQGATALFAAAATACVRSVQLLLQHGVDLTIRADGGACALSAAVQSGSVEVVQLLEQAGMQLSSVSNSGTTLLMQAAVAEDTAVAQYLLSRGAAADAADNTGTVTALHCAIMKDRPKAVKLLLAHGADPNKCTAAGLAPLVGAAVLGSAAIVKLLLAAGADAAAPGTATGSALFAAADCGHADVLKLLLAARGAAAAQLNATVSACECCGPVTALQRCSDLACVKLLLEAGADAKAVTSRGNTALHVAAQHKHSAPVVCMLIKAGASLTAVNSSGLTAAELALARGNTLGAALLSRAAR
jgi:uncharacterized protein